MAFQEFDGELDAAPGAAGFKEFTGELDAAPQPSLVERLKARFYKPATDAAPVDTTGADPMGTGAAEILAQPNSVRRSVLEQPATPEMLARQPKGFSTQEMAEGSVAPWRAKQIADAAAYGNTNSSPVLKPFTDSPTGDALRIFDRKPLDNSLFGAITETVGDAGRGISKVLPSLAKSGYGILQAGAEVAGVDSVSSFARAAQDAGADWLVQFDNPNGDKLVTGAFQSLGTAATGGAVGGTKGAIGLAVGQTAADKYNELRKGGIGLTDSLEGATVHGVAEYLGERVGMKSLARMVDGIASKTGMSPLNALKEALKQQGEEQVTLAIQSAYDKFGSGSLRGDLTLGDYLDDVVTTAQQTAIMTAAAAGGGRIARAATQGAQMLLKPGLAAPQSAPDSPAFSPMTDAANIATAPTVQPAPVNLLERQRPAPIRVEEQPTTPMTPEEILSAPTAAARIDVNNPEAVLAQLGLGQPAAPAAPEAANFSPITPAIAEESSAVPPPAADAPAQQTTDTSSESANEPQYKTRTAAAVNARRTGGAVVEVPGGFTVSPQPTTTGAAAIQAQPAGTRGTVAADLLPAATPPNQQSNAATTETTPDQAPTTGAVRPAERAPIIPAARPAAVEARGAPAKPRKKITTIRGSSVLGAISTQLNGISPTLIADLSRKVQRTRTSKKTGKATQYTAWDNPLHSGYGQLFRSSGTSDLTEIARVLEEEGFIEKGTLERDYLEARAQAEQIVKNELLNGGSTLRQGDAGSVEAEMQRRREMAQDDLPDDLFDGLTEADLAESGYADAPQEVKDLTENLLAQAEAEGIDTEALREDAARATEDQPDDAYQTALQDLARRAIEASRGQDGQADPSAARPGGEDRSQAAGSQGAESGSEGLTSPTAEGLAAADKRARDAEAADRAEQKRLADKANADAQRNEFTLTGSDRPADVAASAGQQDIFAPSAESDSPNDGEKQATSGARTGKIEDFGEKLAGARKDYAALLKDASGVDVAAEPLSKSWPEPDYQKLLDGGGDPFVVAFIHAARDEVPTKPQKSWKIKGWVDGVKLLRSVSQQLLAGEITKDALTEKLDAREFANIKSAVGGRAELYQLVGHDKSLKGITLQKHHYTLYRGEQNVTKWAIEQKAKATAFSNWPREIAVADTKQEVLDQFKAKIASLDLGKKAKGQASQFVIYRKRGQTGAWIGKKIGREYIDLYKADDVNAAREYLAENAEALEAKLTKYRETPFERNAENQPRVGDDHRNGAPVTPEVFADTFGFRGVQFGNYVEQERRQSDLNQAYDALMDMAAVLGIPPRAISLGGRLGLAFGARGKGGKNAPAAHYEPGTVVINLTKGSGPGSLGHEWWHAVDNYFGREFGEGGFVTDGVRADKMRAAMQDAFKAVRVATQVALLRKRAAELDKRRSKPYWNTPLELSARSFESYLIAKLQDQGASNDYLANVVDEKVWNIDEAARSEFFGGEKVETYPYPGQAELPAVRAAFDEFFKTVEMRADDAGNVAMLSRRSDAAGGDKRSPRVAEVTALVDQITSRWASAPDVVVVGDLSDPRIPESIREEDARQQSQGATGAPEGMFYAGKVYLVASELPGDADVVRVLFHEALGHAGLRGTFGKELTRILDRLLLVNESKVRAKALQYGLDFSKPGDRRAAAEEVLAELAQKRPENGLVQSAIAAIRTFLRDRIPGFSRMRMTDAEIVRNFILPARRFVEQGALTDKSSTGATGFSRSDQTQTEAFRRWFGDSKVVDADGKPLVVYHGTKSDFDTFNTDGSELGSHFGTAEQANSIVSYWQAKRQAGTRLIPAYLSIQNPLRLEDVGSFRQVAVVPQLKKLGILPDFVQAGQYSGDAGLRAVRKAIVDAGYDGVVYGNNREGEGDSFIVFRPEQVKSAIGNNGEFDPANADIRFSRAVDTPAPINTPAVRKAKSPWLDTLGRAQFAPGAWAYSKIAPVITERLLTPLKLNTMPKELRGQLRAMKQQIEQAKEVAVKVAAEGFKLSEADRSLVSDIIEGEMAAGTVPPAHAARMAAGINAIMDQQTNDLVALGMLSSESAERWRGAYLPRFYRSKMMQTMREGGAALWALAARKAVKKPGVMQGMKGDGIKGRGLWQTVPADELKNWQALGWEVRDPTYEPDSSPDVQVWRDYSREERDKMGEIRDAGFRFTMGYLRTQRDIALGRLFASVAADSTLSAKDGRQPEGWVQVPDGSIPGTGGVKRYGKLAGMWVSKEVFNHLENHDQGISEAMRLYRKALGMWKEGKTVLNPVSHFNNMAGNISMAHFAGVSYWDAHKYAGAINDLVRNAPMVREAKEAGLFLGTMTQEELLATMPKELRALASMQASKTEAAADWVWNALSLWLRRPAGKLYEAEDQFFRYLIYRDARKRGMDQSDAVDYSQRYVFAYDDLPKGAKLIRDFGIPFFSYTYKAIPTLLHTATHYPHRMLAPAALMWGLNAAMYAIAAGDDDEDWLDSIMAYLNDPERRKRATEMEANERENLPPWMKGNSSLLGTPKAVRLGINEATQLPMFWDISQIMPGGNMFDVENNAGGIGWPQSMMPSHPLMTTMAAMFWNKDTFFGKDIVDDNDTAGERFEKRADWLWKQFTPAIAIGNYHTERLANVIAQMTGEPVRWLPKDATGVGKDGLPVQPELAALQTIGIKVRPIDTDLSEKIDKGQRAKMIRDIDAEMRRLRRLAQKGALSGRNLDAQEELARDKKQRLREGLTVDGEAR